MYRQHIVGAHAPAACRNMTGHGNLCVLSVFGVHTERRPLLCIGNLAVPALTPAGRRNVYKNSTLITESAIFIKFLSARSLSLQVQPRKIVLGAVRYALVFRAVGA